MRHTHLLTILFCLFSQFLWASQPEPLRLIIGEDTTYCATISNAIGLANKADSASITLLDDVIVNNGAATTINVLSNITLDLNGYSLGDTLANKSNGTSLFYINRDTITFTITSSRPGGRLWSARDYNGTIYILSCNRGTVVLEHLTMEVHNTAPDSFSNATACGAGIWTMGHLEMTNCEVYLTSSGAATGVSTSGDSKSAAQTNIRRSHFYLTSGKNSYGINCFPNATIEDCTVEIEQSGSTAYGIHLKAYNAMIARSDTVLIRNTQVSVQAEQKGYGVYGNCPVHMEQCSTHAEARLGTAYGTYILKGYLEADDCSFTGICHQDTMQKMTEALARGLATSAPVPARIHRCTIIAKGTNPLAARGVCGYSTSSTSDVEVQDCNISAEGAENTYGIRVPGDKNKAGRTDIQRCIIQVQGDKSTFGISCFGPTRARDCRIHVSSSGSTAYGINIANFKDTATLIDAQAEVHHLVINVSADKLGYGIYSKAPAILMEDTIRVQTNLESSWGIYTYNDSAEYTISHCSAVTEAGLDKAYGGYFFRGHVVADHCLFSGTSRMDTCLNIMKEAYARGVTSGLGSSVRLEQCQLFAKSTNTKTAKGVYTIYADKNTVFRVTDCELSAEGVETTIGLRGAGDADNPSTIALTRCKMSVKGTRKTYCAMLISKGTINECTLEGEAKESECYGIYTYNGCDSLEVRDCRVKTQAPEKSYVVNNNTNNRGKLFFYGGFYSERTYLHNYLPSDTCSIYPLFSGAEYNAGYRYVIRDKTNPDCIIARVYEKGATKPAGDFKNITDALKYAEKKKNKTFSIILVGDCRLTQGTYVIPSHVSLAVSYTEDQTDAIGKLARRSVNSNYTTPHEFVRLELMDGAQVIVEGALEASAVQKSAEYICGVVTGEFGYGHIWLAPTASITVRDKGQLFAWGYITGEGEVEIEAGGASSEFVQLGEWKGGAVTFEMLNNPYRVFPVSHFFYQNIECPVTYHAGAKAFGSTMVKMGDFTFARDEILLISDSAAFFVMSDSAGLGTTIRKAYNPLTDRMRWTTRGDIALDELNIQLVSGFGNYSIISSNYVLPISSNMDLEIAAGRLTIGNDVTLHPGSQVMIHKDAVVHIPEAVRLFVYDFNDYDTYQHYIDCWAPYSPSWSVSPRDTVSTSARMEIAGVIEVDGSIYTTKGGAQIVGSDDAEGQIRLTAGGAKIYRIYQLTGDYSNHSYHYEPTNSAVLLNADNSYTETAEAKAGDIFYYREGAWTNPNDTIVPPPEEAIETPTSGPHRQVIIENHTIYILDTNGCKYTLLGARIG